MSQILKKPDRDPDVDLNGWEFWFEEMVECCSSCLPQKMIKIGELFYYKTPTGRSEFSLRQKDIQNEYKKWLIRKMLKEKLK